MMNSANTNSSGVSRPSTNEVVLGQHPDNVSTGAVQGQVQPLPSARNHPGGGGSGTAAGVVNLASKKSRKCHITKSKNKKNVDPSANGPSMGHGSGGGVSDDDFIPFTQPAPKNSSKRASHDVEGDLFDMDAAPPKVKRTGGPLATSTPLKTVTTPQQVTGQTPTPATQGGIRNDLELQGIIEAFIPQPSSSSAVPPNTPVGGVAGAAAAPFSTPDFVDPPSNSTWDNFHNQPQSQATAACTHTDDLGVQRSFNSIEAGIYYEDTVEVLNAHDPNHGTGRATVNYRINLNSCNPHRNDGPGQKPPPSLNLQKNKSDSKQLSLLWFNGYSQNSGHQDKFGVKAKSTGVQVISIWSQNLVSGDTRPVTVHSDEDGVIIIHVSDGNTVIDKRCNGKRSIFKVEYSDRKSLLNELNACLRIMKFHNDRLKIRELTRAYVKDNFSSCQCYSRSDFKKFEAILLSWYYCYLAKDFDIILPHLVTINDILMYGFRNYQ